MIKTLMPRTAYAALIGALALLLTGCVGIPSSGSVIEGRTVTEEDTGSIEYIPLGPVAGADQESILSGFMTAFNGSGNYEVARQFLSADLEAEWDPRASVLVRSNFPRLTRVSETAMDVSIVANAWVDTSGTYSPLAPDPQTLHYEFVQEDGEWRISAAPDGIVLFAGTFTRLFSPHALYFLDPSRQSLVPDLRWFPGGTAPTRIVSALLDGPPEWLQGAVGTAFPDGTQLTSPKRVAVESNVALVDLTAEALSADENQRQLMRVQLEASLGKVPSISSLDITVEGAPLVIGEPGPGVPQPHPQVDGRMLVLQDGEFGFYANNQIAAIEGISNKVVATNPRAATLAANGTAAATLGDGGVYLVRARNQEPALIDTRPGLIAPSLDGYGYVWSAQGADPGSIRVFDGDGVAHEVTATLPAGAEIVSLDVSSDGTRVAIFLETNAGPRLIVAAVIRDANREQVPAALGEPKLDTIAESGTAIDATWLDELSIATLTRTGESTDVVVYKIGGQSEPLGSPADAIAIVGGNGENGLRVLGEDGVVSTRRGSGWQGGQTTVSFIATQR